MSLRLTLFFVLPFGAVVLAYHVPQFPPKPLNEIQDPANVQAHAEAAQRNAKPNAEPVISAEWIKQIQAMVEKNSKRELKPAEFFHVVFRKDGKLAELEAVFPTNADRTPNEANQSHNICSVKFNGKEGKLHLSDEKAVEGPDDQELFSLEQLPIIIQELSVISRLQQAFTANELKYTLEARVQASPDAKSWVWEIGPSEEQHPNVIYGIYYYPTNAELRVIPIERPRIAKKVEEAARQAGLRLTYVKSMNDR